MRTASPGSRSAVDEETAPLRATSTTHPAAPERAAPAGPVSAGRLATAVRATRPLYLPTSLVPALAGLAAAIGTDGARWWLAAPAVMALAMIHAGTNAINDVEDFDRGVDGPDKHDNSRVFTTGLMSVAQGRMLARGLFAGGVGIGVALAVLQGPALLVYGIAGAAVGYLYSAGPSPLKYVGLGDVAIVPTMGPLITQGAYTAVTGDGFEASVFWLGLAPGLLIAAVLAANNLSDIRGDAAAGVRTLAVRFGFAPARGLYLGMLAAAYACPLVLVAAGAFGWPLLLPLATIPLGLRLATVAGAADSPDDPQLAPLAARTASLHLGFCLLLVLGVAASALL